MSRLEIYGIALLVLALALAGSYAKGRLDEKSEITQKQLADNAQAMQRYQDVAKDRADDDDKARQRMLAFIATIDQGLDNVSAKFSKLPSVVVDARGCERITPAAALRWNAVELLPAGSTDQPTRKPPDPLPASQMPPP